MKVGSNKNYIIFGAVLVLGGLFGIGFPFIYELFVSDDFELQLNPVIQAQLPTFEDSFIGQGEDISATPVPVISTQVVVKDHLVISSGNINMPVFLGDTEKILNKGGWMFPFTSRPELGSNTVIFGHRWMYRPPKSNTFWNLDKVKVGDEMVLFWKGKEYKYKVSEIKIVEPTDLSVIQSTADARLTVITCTPLFSTKYRLVVIGSLVN